MNETKIQIARPSIEIPVSDIYNYTIKQLILDTFEKYTKEAVLRLLQDTEWIEPLFHSASQVDRIKLYYSTLKDMKCGLCPHPLVWSAIYYHLKKLGIDTYEMRIIINTSAVLKNELKNNELWRLIWN